MSRTNPYDDYDAFDPFTDDEDETGGFSFVEDEYDSMEDGVGDGFTYVDSPLNYSEPADLFPKTQVRNAPFARPMDVEEPAPQKQRRGILRRRKKDKDPRQAVPQAAGGYQQYAGQNQDYGRPAPQQGMSPIRRRKRHHFGCLVTLLLIVGMVVGLYWLVAHPIDERLAFSPAERETVNGTLSWSVPGMPYYVLALGSDAREGESSERSDTMVLIRVDFIGGKLTLVSIPRDTKVELDGYGTSKINAAYAYGGAGGAVRAVSKLTGVPVNHVAVIHFEELVGLIDYLGGVTVNVPVDVYDPDYSGLTLSAGTQTLDGETALLWARTRYGFADGDHQRQTDQRILMTAIMNRILSLSPRELPGVLEQIGGLIGTDLRCYDLVPLFIRFKLFSPTVYSCAIPTSGEMIDGYWYEIVDETAKTRLMQVVNSGGDPSTV